ncbi:hypothetical protein Fmac_015295 [Flemingia macrophylla]|uniref:Uncharacterized protein n=1 Tax=Flemingia macrophylla TaxID=520843 RepID=A0ABD1MER0_9FABA
MILLLSKVIIPQVQAPKLLIDARKLCSIIRLHVVQLLLPIGGGGLLLLESLRRCLKLGSIHHLLQSGTEALHIPVADLHDHFHVGEGRWAYWLWRQLACVGGVGTSPELGQMGDKRHHHNMALPSIASLASPDGLYMLNEELAANQKSASVARVCGIRSSDDHHSSVCPSSQQSGLSARNDVIVITGVHDMATETSAEARKQEGKLDALVNLVTQLAANQKSASVSKVWDIHSSNDNHTSFSARNDAIVIRGVHHVAKDTSPEAIKLEGKLDTLVNLVTQRAANQKPAFVARVCGIRSSNHHHPSITTKNRDKALDREDGSQLLAPAANQEPASVGRVCGIRSSNDHHTSEFSARNDVILIRGVHDVAIDTSSEARKLEGKLDALVNLVTQLAANQKPASISKVCSIRSSNDHHTSVCPSSQQSGLKGARNDAIVIRGVHDVSTDTSAEARKLEGKLDPLVNLVTQLAASQKPASVARFSGIRSSIDHHTSVCPSSQQSGVDEHPEAYAANTYRVHDVATDTSAEAIKLEGKLDTLVNLVTQRAANQKPAFVARVCGIRSSNHHHPSVCPFSQQSGVDEHHGAYAANTYSRPPQQGVHDVATDTSSEARKLEGKLEALEFSARNDVILIRGVHDVATDTSSEARKLEGKLDALVKLLTQLAASHKPTSVARFCGIRSSIDHHTSVCPSSQQSGQLSARNDVIVIRGVHDVATDTSAEARKLEGKLDALVNLVTQLAANQKPASVARVCDHHSSRDKALDREDGSQLLALRVRNLPLLQDSVASVLPLTTTLVSVLLRSNLEWKSIMRLMLQTPIADHHKEREKALDRENGSQLLALQSARNDAIVIRGVHDLAANQKSASVARVCNIRSSNDNHTSFSVRNDAIVVRGVDDVATNTSAEARKLEGKLDALVNLVTQLVTNQKPAFVVRVCGIRSSNDDHTSVCPSSQQSGVYEHPEAYAANIYNRPPQQGVHDVATDTSAEARKLEGNLDALVSVVTPLAANQKLAFVARVCGIRSSNDHHTSVCPSSQQSGVDEQPEAYAANTYRGVHDVATDTSVEARKLEGKLDALVNLVSQLAANQKPAFFARVCGIRSSNDNHTSFSARNDAIVIRGVHDVATDTSAKARKLEGKLDALMSLVTQLAGNQKPAYVARDCDIRSSNDHHTSVCPSSQQSLVDEHPEAYAANTYSRPPQ